MVDANEELQHRFLVRCKEAYELVQGFLNDTLPWGLVPKTKSGYHYNDKKRDGVKKKVTESITNIEQSIRNHGYVSRSKWLNQFCFRLLSQK